MRLVATELMFAQALRCSPITENSLKQRRTGRPGIAAGRVGGVHGGNAVGAIDDRAADAGAAKAC